MDVITKNSKNPLRSALLLATFSALGPFTVDMYLSSLPEMVSYFSTTVSLVQTSLTAGLLGLASGQIVIGPLSDAHGRRKPLLISMVLYSLISLACAFSPSITLFIALRFFQGFVAAAGFVTSRAIVRDRYSGVEMTRFMSLLITIGSIAPLISPIAGSTVTTFTSWAGAFVFLSFLGIFLTFVTILGIKESLPVHRRVSSNFLALLKNYGSLLRNRKFMGYALVNGCMFAGAFAYVAGTPFIYQNIYQVAPQPFSILFALNGFGIILGAQTVKRLVGRITERQIYLGGLQLALFSTIAIMIVVFTHGPLLAMVISIFLYAVSLGVIGPVSFSLALASQGRIAGSATAVIGTLQYALGAISSPLVGIAGEYSALPFGVTIFSASVLAIISYAFLVKKSVPALAE